MRSWERESFEEFWAVARHRATPELLATLDPRQELYFRLDSVHVALEIYRGLQGAFVNLSIGDGRAWWVRDLAEWLRDKGFKRLYFAAETQSWGRVLMTRYQKLGMTAEPIVARPGWSTYYLNLSNI